MSAKRREDFLKMLKMLAVRIAPMPDSERAAVQSIKTIGSESHYSPRPTNEQITLAEIKDMLIGLSKKVDRLEQKISNIDSHISEGLNLSNKTKFQTCVAIAKQLIVKNICLMEDQFKVKTEEYLLENEADFYEGMDNRDWNTYYEDKLAKPVNFFINLITFTL
ncbi:hypothetical protein F8M41_017227 [Gigaspora margarita]|uniref:Uncharacterized protein n=1 Tax=Gigaspora margarita TaxID=4874 RepID=A0A8H4ANI1_GIGMA|nr:hypothetical protein F8M41_017227 [Gigaspora margarita]